MDKLVDVNGLEFKVGCIYERAGYKALCYVFDIYDGNILASLGTYGVDARSNFHTYCPSKKELSSSHIVSYRELAPDKNGFMLCEGDTVSAGDGSRIVIDSKLIAYINTYCILQNPNYPTSMTWCKPERLTFVSRPTESAKKKAELQAEIDKLSDELAKNHSKFTDEIARLKKEVGL